MNIAAVVETGGKECLGGGFLIASFPGVTGSTRETPGGLLFPTPTFSPHIVKGLIQRSYSVLKYPVITALTYCVRLPGTGLRSLADPRVSAWEGTQLFLRGSPQRLA